MIQITPHIRVLVAVEVADFRRYAECVVTLSCIVATRRDARRRCCKPIGPIE